MTRSEDESKFFPWSDAGWAAAIAAGLLVMATCTGNTHGASKTDLDIMPSYPVGEAPAPVTSGPVLPSAAKRTGMWVCARIVVDRQRGEVIINPVVEEPASGRPLYLAGVTASGAQFASDLPRDNFSVFKLNGGEDNDQRITPDECHRTDVVPRAVKGIQDSHILVEADSDVPNGAVIRPGPEGALRVDQVHGQFNGLTDERIDTFLDSLPVPAGR